MSSTPAIVRHRLVGQSARACDRYIQSLHGDRRTSFNGAVVYVGNGDAYVCAAAWLRAYIVKNQSPGAHCSEAGRKLRRYCGAHLRLASGYI